MVNKREMDTPKDLVDLPQSLIVVIKELKSLIPQMVVVEDPIGDKGHRTIHLGSFMSMDPCERYHHILSPNGATKTCENYWERLDEAAESLGGWIESGEGDPTDIYFCLPLEEDM